MIAYYVHHKGRGHVSRALAITRHLPCPVTFLSSLPDPGTLRAGDEWVALPLDVPADGTEPVDPTARGTLHWVPRHVKGLARRSAMVAEFLAARGPRRMVVDVSVEIVLLARLCGIPVTVVAMPGDRTDRAHTLAYDVAEQIIAPWTERVYRPAWLAKHSGRTHYVGFISRFDGVPRPARPRVGPPRALLFAGSGGDADPPHALDELCSVAPGFDWMAIGGSAPWIDEPWPLLATAELVVCHAGQNAIADVALAAPAAVVIAQDRPFGEQAECGRLLEAAGIGVVVPHWPDRDQWPSIVSRAMAADAGRWGVLGVQGAAQRAAAVIAS